MNKLQKGRGEHDIYIASATGKPRPPSKTEGIPDDSLRGVSSNTGADLLQNFCWDVYPCPLGNASCLTTSEDELEEHNKHSVTSGRKRSHYDIEDDKEASSAKLYECKFCGIKFHKSQALGGHMNRHKQERKQESLNKACELLQHANPSPILPGLDHTLSSHSKFGSYHTQGSNIPTNLDILGVAAHQNYMEYAAGGRSPPSFTEATDHSCDGRENVNVRSQISAMHQDAAYSYSNAEYLNASSRSVPADMDTLQASSDDWSIVPPRPSMRMPFMHQPSTLDQLSTQGPYMSNDAKGYRGVLQQTWNSQQVLPSIASMQPGVLHAEAVYRDPTYPLPIESMKEPTSLGIETTSLGIAHAEVGCRGPPLYQCPNEGVRDSTSLAGHDASLSSLCEDSQGLRLRSLPLHASTRAAPLDTGQERMLFGGASLAMGGDTHTDAGGSAPLDTGQERMLFTRADKRGGSTTSTSAEHEGGLDKKIT